MGFNGYIEESCERIVDQIMAGRDVACWSRRREGGGGEAAGITSGPGSKVGLYSKTKTKTKTKKDTGPIFFF